MKNKFPQHPSFRTTRCAFAVALLVTMAACGGGGGGSSGFIPTSSAGSASASGGGNGVVTAPVGEETSPVVAPSFTGTAASGLPLTGQVTVKDAKGATKTVQLVDGNYTVDVSGMTGPFVFRAEGRVAGQDIVLHSAATQADANGVINITPFTDLIVANIAGSVAAKYFEGGNFAGLSAAELSAESAALKAKLLPVLLALKVDASIDLLRTAFTPLSSALDKALDVLRVSVDPATNVATILNIVTQQQITDDLAVKAAQDAGTTPLASSPALENDAAADIPLIRKALTDFAGKFKDGLPAPAELTPMLVSMATTGYNFRFSDQSLASFVNEISADASMVGASFTDIVIRRINYTIDADNLNPRAFVDFTHRDKNGVAFSNNQDVQIIKGTDGVWRMRGDGRVLSSSTIVQALKDDETKCVSTGLQFQIEDNEPGNSTAAAYVVVTGPGLPTAGVRLNRPAVAGSYWPIANGDGGNFYVLATDCADQLITAGLSDAAIEGISATPSYVYTGYTSANVVANITTSTFPIQFTDRPHGRPLSLKEAKAVAYPVVSTSIPLDSYTGGDIGISATGLNPAFSTEFYLSLFSTLTGAASDQADLAPSKAGAASKTFSLPTAGGQLARYVFVQTRDDNWRALRLRQRAVQAPPPAP